MAFYLGAALGKIGEAFQVDNERAARKLEKDEDRVALLTNTALDYGTQVYLDKKKDTEKTRKAIEQGMATLAGTGLSRAARFKIASGGSAAISNVLGQYNTAIENNRDVDFSTIYDVKNSGAFKDMSDDDFFATVMPSVSPDLATQTSRTFLERRKGMPGYENLDVDSVMSQFQTTAGLSDDTTVLETPTTLGELSVNFKRLRSAIGKEDKPKEFSSPTEAKTYYTGLILDEKERKGGGDATLIASYEGRVSAYDNLIVKKDTEDKPFDVEKRLKEIPGLIFALENSNEEGAATKITNLKAERDGYLEHNKIVAASKDKGGKDPKETLNTMLDNVQRKIINAEDDELSVDAIAKLGTRRDAILTQLSLRSKKTGTGDTFKPNTALSYINSTVSSLLRGESYAKQVTPLSEKLEITFGDGRDGYANYFGRLESALKELKEANNSYDSDVLTQEITKYENLNLKRYTNEYINKFAIDNNEFLADGTTSNPNYMKAISADYITTYPNFDEAKNAATSGSLKPGSIVIYERSDGKKAIEVWTGQDFR